MSWSLRRRKRPFISRGNPSTSPWSSSGTQNLLPYFIVTLEEFTRRGIGRGRKPFTLGEITAVNPLTGVIAAVYRGEDRIVRPRELSVKAEDLWNRVAGYPGDGLRKIEINLTTPTRITYRGESGTGC